MTKVIYFLILFQEFWIEINWQEKYPLPLAILSIYWNCKLKNNQSSGWSAIIFWLYFKIFGQQSIERRNTLFHWQSYQFEWIVRWRTIIKILLEMITLIYFLIYFKRFVWKSIDRRNTLFHWKSCEFATIVSWRTINIFTEANTQLFSIIFYFQNLMWQSIDRGNTIFDWQSFQFRIPVSKTCSCFMS
jgi:hypothetical protein